MVIPSILSIREFYRELCDNFKGDESPEVKSLADSIEARWESWDTWSDIPLFLKVFYGRDFNDILILTKSLISARSKSPWRDMLNPNKDLNTVWGDIFDAFVKRSLSMGFGPDCTVPLIGSGKSIDAQVNVMGHHIGVEASALGQSKADKKYWDELIRESRTTEQRSGLGVRNSDPYEAVLRVTEKFLQKVADQCQPEKCQLLKDRPNLLFLSFPDSVSVGPMDLDVSWALDSLFSEAPWSRMVVDGVKDVWSVLERKVVENQAADPNDSESFDPFMRQRLWPQFKLVSGVLLFEECRFVRGRVNYHCHEENTISHAAMGEIERIMSAADRTPFQIINRWK